MDNKFKKGIEDLKKISLTDEEKNKMLHNLKLHVKFHQPVKNHYSFKNIFSSLPKLALEKMSYVLASILILVLAGGSVTYASEKSLPGDILYPVKINVVEPIREAMAVTPDQKAQVEAGLAEERLREAETLSVEGKLSTTTADNLNNNYKEHEKNFFRLANEIPGNKNPNNIPNVQKEFENRINSHADILQKINHDLPINVYLSGNNNLKNASSSNLYRLKNSTTTKVFNKFPGPKGPAVIQDKRD